MRVALHGHYYYPELLDELILAMAANRHPMELYLSTDTEAKAKDLEARCATHGRRAEIRVVPNRGRDLGALLTGFRDLFAGGYDLVGHVHGKKTPQLEDNRGDRWRRNLLDHTIGGAHAMADPIFSTLAADAKVGLVFAESRYTLNWDYNIASAAPLARAMNMPEMTAILRVVSRRRRLR
jgi:lipopolysaccharide biosynthesis protein